MLTVSYIPIKIQGVDILLAKNGDILLRRDGDTHNVSGISQTLFTGIWNLIDGKRNLSEIHASLKTPQPPTIEEVIEIIEKLHGFVLQSASDSIAYEQFTREPDTQEKKLNTREYKKDFDNQHLNLTGNIPSDSCYKKILILGGGTAGYFTALAFQKLRPDIEITLVESSKIPVIGVGEATTPIILSFLHDTLGISPKEFYKSVKPSWKLGINFDWGLAGDHNFFNPFGINNLLESFHFNKSLDHVTLGTTLMMKGKGLIARRDDGSLYSLMNQVGYAYHLENKSLIAYLKGLIKDSNINWLDRTVNDVNVLENGDVGSLITDQDEALTADLFIDCSGFRSVLLKGAVKSEYISYDKSLFTDRAVTGAFSDAGKPDPFTIAQTMKCGWNWNVPVRGDNHRGYVYSSDHCTEDEAMKEMHQANPEIEDFKVIRFKSGRCKDFWKNNVVGIGNAYGFVEPLESTGLHMIIESVKTLIKNLPIEKHNRVIPKILNEKIGSQWDYIKWYLAIHFKYNKKIDSSFWTRCQNETDVSGIQELLDIYAQTGPLTAVEENDPELMRPFLYDRIFGAHGFDYLLMGQHVPFGNQYIVKPEESGYPKKKAHWEKIASEALSNKESLEMLYKQPDLITQLV